MSNLIVTLNWVLGSCLFAVAVMYPLLGDYLFRASEKTVVEQHVAMIYRSEKGLLGTNKDYVYFAPGKMPDEMRKELGLDGKLDRDFIYEAKPGEDGSGLIIRAHVKDEKIKSGELPVMVYTQTFDDKSGKHSEGEWTLLPAKKAGLLK